MRRTATLKWLEIVRFEVTYQLRRLPTWFFFAIFALMLFGQTNGQVMSATQHALLFYSPLFIAKTAVPMGLFALLTMAAIAGDAATRDVETRIEPLMHASPIGRLAYLGGRFTAAFILNALVMLAIPLALILARVFLGAAASGPIRPEAFVQTYFLLLLPNAFVASAFLFAAATKVRHTVGSYAAAALVFSASLLSLMISGKSMGRWDLAKLLDPAGLTPLRVMADSWSPIDLNGRLVGLSGGLLWNRLLWLALAWGALAFTYAKFRYGANDRAARWWQRRRAAEPNEFAVADRAPITILDVPRTFAAAGRMRQLLATARDSIMELATPWTLLLLPLLGMQAFLAVEEMTVRGTPLLATTGRVLAAFSEMPPPIADFIFFFSVLFAGELVWRERDANIQALSDAAPVPDWVRFAGKILGMWLVIVAWHALLMLSGIGIQLWFGWHDFDLPLYVKVLFGLRLVAPLVFAVFVFSIHTLVNQKHAGHATVIALLMAGSMLAEEFAIEHPLLLPMTLPGWRWSAISGFDPFVAPYLWFMLYWAGWTLLLAFAARLFWVRGVQPGMRERLRIAGRRFSGRMIVATASVLSVVVLVGGFIFYNTNIRNEYRSSADDAERQAEYERRYHRYDAAPQPQPASMKVDVEIYPEQHGADIRGVYTLVNRTPQMIDTIHVAVPFAFKTGAIDFDRAARAEVLDDAFGHRSYVLKQPLQPGQSVRMSWQVSHHPRGFTARGIHTAVVANGTFIDMPDWMPLIGYQSRRELSEPEERKRHGLPPQVDVYSLDNVAARRDPTGQELFDLDVTVGTAANQTAVAPGELLGTWMRNGRRYFHYASPAIGYGYAVFSADYAVRRARAGDIAIEVVHIPAHTGNVDRMIRSMQRSLEQYTQRFGPYPYKVLRLVEYVRKDGGAHAAHATIWYSEVFPLMDPAHDERGFDLPFAVIAHETAHQFQVAPARVEGAALLSESFAWYAAMSVIEQEYGTAHLSRFLDFMRRDYLTPRSRADVPLLRASDKFLAYRKGPFAMFALREYVGQNNVDLAWRRLREQHASHQPPFATSLDLLRELQAVTPASLRSLLGDLLERNTFWELKTKKATAQQIATGAWRVTLDVEARKVAVDKTGVETNLAMNDPIEIGVFGPNGDQPLYRAMQPIRTGLQTITITVPQRPTTAGIDPRHLLIDVVPDDNMAPIAIRP